MLETKQVSQKLQKLWEKYIVATCKAPENYFNGFDCVTRIGCDQKQFLITVTTSIDWIKPAQLFDPMFLTLL